ncbi:nucleotidyltransferase family protein [Ilyomonas limi]|uniref:Nucleotidyltransferase family protein n=1 Tax=Ilyomonas limi TaxID=2575867 RepID=A0A4V5UUF3_9BACT|nr:sugar phosphate nucleotidyltransferase [Ilyomonas limi]TKK68863.1 nucleotidyltransferase family protein [Ilyomonas limi]
MKSNFVSNHFQHSSLGKESNGIRAMILAAGLGTRLKPFTNSHPKALAIINGKSLLQRNIEYLQQYGIFNIIVNTHHFASQIEEAIVANKGWGSNVTISYEAQVLETGGGLKYATPYFKDSNYFVLMNADVLTDMPLDKMIVQHMQQHPLATVATCNRNSSRYLLFDDNDILCGWQNINTGQVKMARPAENYTQQAFSGIHIISNCFLDYLQSFEGKFSIIDVYLKFANNSVIQAFKHDDYLFIDVGKPESLTIAENLFK